MGSNFVNPGELGKREVVMLPRNEKRHRELINNLLDLLRQNNIDIPDDSLTEYLEKRFFTLEVEEDKTIDVFIRNHEVHRDVIYFLNELLQSNNIDINTNLKDYITNINKYDCQWEDYRKESGDNGKR